MKKLLTSLSLLFVLSFQPAVAAEAQWQQGTYAAIRLSVAPPTSATTLPVLLEIKLQPGWHTYGVDAGDTGYPPNFSWQQVSGVRAAEIGWPASTPFTFAGITSRGYNDYVALPLLFTRDAEKVTLRGTVDLLVCEKICVPEFFDVALEWPPASTTNAVWQQVWDSRVSTSPLAVTVTPTLPTETAVGPMASLTKAFTATPSQGLWHIIILAFLGGLILNVMPCVLPVLSLKMFKLLKGGGQDKAHVRGEFLASAAGIMTFFVLLAITTAVIKILGGGLTWGTQLQQPFIVAILVVVLTLMACNLLGFYEFTMPTWFSGAISKTTSKPSRAGSFWAGFFATIIATPCSAPLLGTALSYALVASVPAVLLIFLSIGIGFATPYWLVAAFPTLAMRLPKPGAWMYTVQRVLAGFVLAVVVYELYVLSVLMDIAVAATVGILLLGLLGLMALRHGANQTIRRWLLVPVLLIVGLILLLPLVVTKAPYAATDFSPQRLTELLADNKVVVVDVSAAWCITCHANKLLVLDREPVASALRADDVVFIQLDWTRRDEVIKDYLHANGRAGIPFNKVYGFGAPDGIILPELLSADAVLTALQTARGQRDASDR